MSNTGPVTLISWQTKIMANKDYVEANLLFPGKKCPQI